MKLVINEGNNLTTDELINYENQQALTTYTQHKWPSGIMGELAKQTEEMMVFPNKEIAIIAARHALVAISGRKAVLDGSRIISLDFLFADQAVGKDTVAKTLSKIITEISALSQVKDYSNRLAEFRGVSGTFGVRALHMAFMASPSISVIISEAGVSSKSTAGDNPNITAYMLTNPAKEAFDPHTVKGFTEGLPTVHCPGMAYMEESVMETAKHIITSAYIKGGEMARRTFIFATHKTRVNPDRRQKYSEELIQGLKKIVDHAMVGENYAQSKKIGKINFIGPTLIPVLELNKDVFQYDVEAKKKSNTMLKDIVRFRESCPNGASDKPVTWALKGRVLAKVKQDALLLANCSAVLCGGPKIVTMAHFQEALDFTEESDNALRANLGLFDTTTASNLLDVVVKAFLKLEASQKGKGKYRQDRIFKASDVFAGTSKPQALAKSIVAEGRFPLFQVKINMFKEGQDSGLWIFSPSGNDDFRKKYQLPVQGQYIQLKIKSSVKSAT